MPSLYDWLLVCSPLHALGFASGAGLTGVLMLYFGVNPLTAGLGAFNLAFYTLAYTPMKRLSVYNTWVGSVVGAIPPMMGWTACTAALDPGKSILQSLHLVAIDNYLSIICMVFWFRGMAAGCCALRLAVPTLQRPQLESTAGLLPSWLSHVVCHRSCALPSGGPALQCPHAASLSSSASSGYHHLDVCRWLPPNQCLYDFSGMEILSPRRQQLLQKTVPFHTDPYSSYSDSHAHQQDSQSAWEQSGMNSASWSTCDILKIFLPVWECVLVRMTVYIQLIMSQLNSSFGISCPINIVDVASCFPLLILLPPSFFISCLVGCQYFHADAAFLNPMSTYCCRSYLYCIMSQGRFQFFSGKKHTPLKALANRSEM